MGHCAMSPLTPLQAGGVLFPTMACWYDLPTAGPIGQRLHKMAEAQSVGRGEGWPPAGDRPLPRGKRAIKLMRPGVATVASHQVAGL